MKDFLRIFFAVLFAGLIIVATDHKWREIDAAKATRAAHREAIVSSLEDNLKSLSELIDTALLERKHAARIEAYERYSPLVDNLTQRISREPSMYPKHLKDGVIELSQRLNELRSAP